MMSALSEGIASYVLFIVLLIGGMHFGHRIGNKMRARHEDVTKGTGTVEGGVLGLLGLILAFVLLNGEKRFEARNDLALAQVNAIGTAYDQSKALPEASRAEIQSLMRRYATAERRMFQHQDSKAYEDPDYLLATDLYWRLWNKYVLACSAFSAEYCASMVLPSINRIQEVHLHQLIARQTHAPREVILLVIMLSTGGAALCGFSLASHAPKRMRLHSVIYLVALAATYYTIVDLEYPRAPTIRSSILVDTAYNELYRRMGIPS